MPCPPQAEEVLEAPLEEEEEADVTTVMTSTSREEVRCVKLAGCSAGALASWLFAALCAGLLTHVAAGLVPGAAPPGWPDDWTAVSGEGRPCSLALQLKKEACNGVSPHQEEGGVVDEEA